MTEKKVNYKPHTGRPRTVSPSPDECIELGQEMVMWVIENNPTHLTEWYSIEKMIPWKMWNAMCELPEFLPYYEVALNLVARNSRNGTLEKSISQRFLSLYHRDLRKYEEEVKKFESELKHKEDEQVDEQVKESVDKLFSQLSSLQSARKIDRSNMSDETKS